MKRIAACVLTALFALSIVLVASASYAQTPDQPTVSIDAIGHGKVRLTITTGASGAPDGVGVLWMKRADYLATGQEFGSDLSDASLQWAFFYGRPTLNVLDGVTSYELGPYQTVEVEIGDLDLETGVSTNTIGELASAETYVAAAFANGAAAGERSALSSSVTGTSTPQGGNCTYTIGYWKTHPSAWPVTSLTLGTVTYTKAQLLQILSQAVKGNGLVSMAHQLIGAKLNLAYGASGASISGTIAAADAQIGGLVVPPIGGGSLAPGSTSGKTQLLDDFNNGISGPGHCGETPTVPRSWGQIKSLYR